MYSVPYHIESAVQALRESRQQGEAQAAAVDCAGSAAIPG